MLKIGEFSQLSQVTIKTLRHYDQLGLLVPARIDRFTNYRYYTVEQLPRIHRIVALKELGLTLEQIGLILDDELPTDQIRGMLRLQQAQVRQQIQEAQLRIKMIEFRLHMIDAEVEFPPLDVVLKRLEPLRCLSYFAPPRHPDEDASRRLAGDVAKIKQAIAAGLIDHTGVAIDVFHGETMLPFDSPELGESQHEVLLGVTAGQESVSLDGLGHWTVRDVPPVDTAATLILSRDDSGLEHYEKAALLRRWVVARGYEPSGQMRFLHHRGPLQTLNRGEFLVEAQLPIDAST